MIKCVIIDDEVHAIEVIKAHISKVPVLGLAYATTNPVEAFQYVQQHKPDLIFLDIQMPELDGLSFLKLLNGNTKVILTTAYREHALTGYEYNVTDYLLKPVLFERFLKAVQKVIPAASEEESAAITIAAADKNKAREFLFVKTGARNKVVRVLISDIAYIESKGNYLTFVTDTGKITTLLSLKELEAELPKNLFVRIHNSYIVAINRIVAMEGNQIQAGVQSLPVGDAFKKGVQDIIRDYIVNKK